MHPYLITYLVIASVVAVISLTLGLIFGKRLLGNGMVLGLFNSATLGIFWPMTVLLLAVGKIYDIVTTFKKL